MPGVEPGSAWPRRSSLYLHSRCIDAHAHRRPIHEARLAQRLVKVRRRLLSRRRRRLHPFCRCPTCSKGQGPRRTDSGFTPPSRTSNRPQLRFLTGFTSVSGSSARQLSARLPHVEAVSSPYVKEHPARSVADILDRGQPFLFQLGAGCMGHLTGTFRRDGLLVLVHGLVLLENRAS